MKTRVSSLGDIPAVAAYLGRIGAKVRSMRAAVIEEPHGNYWKDVAIVRLGRDGTIGCSNDNYAPTENEVDSIKKACENIEFPSLVRLASIAGTSPPPQIRNANIEDVYEFRSPDDGNIVMVQVRVDDPKHGKRYVPWTHWDDGVWRNMEPDGPLPLYGADKIGDHTTVFIHEGAKAARLVAEMVAARTPEMREKLAAHPWGRELSGAGHVGWIGGALSPLRSDFSVFGKRGVKRAIIVSDNDFAGMQALPAISRQCRVTAWHLQFSNEWPASFDLGDDFPKSMFRDLDGVRRYVGPNFADCLHPATWATDLIPNPSGKGKAIAVLRDCFKEIWAYVEEMNMFVCVEMPQIMYSAEVLNNHLAAFSHVKDTAALIVKTFTGRKAKVCYRPDFRGRILYDGSGASLNMHVPARIEATAGDPQPFLEYLNYMFPVAGEAHEIKRWLATLIARPETRMVYGLLLVSEAQGVGKTTLANAILRPLLGAHNVGWPNENDITQSQFNGYAAFKRLVVISEVYSGHSWKAYHLSKTLVTDETIQINRKYQESFTIQNFAHVIACSNSPVPLKVEKDDRRWFFPKMVEIPWTDEQFGTFRSWLQSGGLGVVKWWAEQWGDYVKPGARSPMTARKRELILDSRSEAQTEAARLGEALQNYEKPAALAMQEIKQWVRGSAQGKVIESDIMLRKAMVEEGCVAYDGRLKIAGVAQPIVMNRHAYHAMIEHGSKVLAMARNGAENGAALTTHDTLGRARVVSSDQSDDDILKAARADKLREMLIKTDALQENSM